MPAYLLKNQCYLDLIYILDRMNEQQDNRFLNESVTLLPRLTI